MKSIIYKHQIFFLTLAILLSCSSIIISSDNDSIDQITPVLLTAETPVSVISSPISIINPQIHMDYYELVRESVDADSHPGPFKIECSTNFSCFTMTTEEEVITCQDNAIITPYHDFFISHQTRTFHACCCICQFIGQRGLESVDE